MKETRYWFPAKRYGWGWGLPVCWQGWTVFGIWIALLVGGSVFRARHPLAFAVYAVAIGVALVIVCLLKGEKPRWRWGGDGR